MKALKWGMGLLVLIIGAFLALSFAGDTDPDEMGDAYLNEASQFAPADGYQVHFRDQGQGPAVVLLHGLGASLHTFEPLVALLRDDYRIITIDLPGHGLTGPHPREDYSMEARFAAVDAVLDQLQIDRFALGGNSMGGEVSWAYAVDRPSRPTAMILLNASGVPSGNSPSAFGKWFVNSTIFEWLARNITPRWFIASSLDASVSNKAVVTDAAVDRYWKLLRLPGNRQAQVLWSRLPRNDQRFARLGDVTIPALIIWGSEDQLIPARNAQRFSEAIPENTVHVYEDTGHLPMEEVPERTATDIADFLKDVFR